MLSKAVWKILIFSVSFYFTNFGFSQSKKDFKKCNPGKQFTYKNQAGQVKILICAGLKDGVPEWQYTDGSSTLGEKFNPARDCPDIVDHLPDAEDGFYWVSFGTKTKHKVWCDVHTDDGGFMLVGMKNSPVSWTVPSNSIPVDPKGPPHWSSKLGDIKILDFGVQFSSDKSFERTKAHWFYRLNQKRQLGNIFSNDVSTGCSINNPGIGDIKYIKDVQSDSITTTNFKCSIFGPHTHNSLGWARMNYCLRNTCKKGYGVIPGPFSFQYTQYGSFSYSAVAASTGMGRNSTAFLGCDNGKCCGCFGPKGGRQNYCGPGCTAINGGTVIKNVFVWFWVRNRMPERLWKRCMEFTMKNSAGVSEKYFIDPRTGTAHKGSCSEQFKTFLNEGTLTVADKKEFKKIPNVPGLLSYRKDNQQLYVNNGSKWQPLDNEGEVRQLQQEVKSLETQLQTRIKKLEKGSKIYPSCSILRQTRPTADSGTYLISPIQGLLVSVFCDMTSKNGVGVTEIAHDSGSRSLVSGCQPPGCYKRKIKYDISLEQIVAIIKQSKNCEQFIRYECYDSVVFYANAHYAWWVSRQGSKMNYWGGAAVDSGKCACGMTNSCAGGLVEENVIVT